MARMSFHKPHQTTTGTKQKWQSIKKVYQVQNTLPPSMALETEKVENGNVNSHLFDLLP